jgi:predicted nucleotidyltransferase
MNRSRIIVAEQNLEAFCQRWNVVELSLFGSAVRDDFRSDSDIDLLVTFAPDAHWTLFDLVDMEDELKSIFGRDVDLVERHAIELSENYIRRKDILSNLTVLYVS